MADILIKGMEMPKGDIPLVLIIMSDGTVEEIDDSDEINATDAKAIELPPHGRLGDLDKAELDYKATTAKCVDSDPQRKKGYLEAERLVLKILQKTPTIVEAST